MRGLVLIGYRACGKTTIGRRVAAQLAWPFVDADQALEAKSGRTIKSIFAKNGESAFRDLESAVIADLLNQPGPWVLATGGGVVLRPENRAALQAWGGPVVYLQAPAEHLSRRLARDAGGRPSLTGGSVADEVATLLAQRDPLYQATAHHRVDATKPITQTIDTVIAIVENFGDNLSAHPTPNP